LPFVAFFGVPLVFAPFFGAVFRVAFEFDWVGIRDSPPDGRESIVEARPR
jgi:hypothetical protein